MKKRSVSVLIAILSLAVVLFGCGTSPDANKKSSEQPKSGSADVKPVTVTIGMLKLAGSTPFFIASEKGYFKEEGINVEYKWFDSSNAVNVAVASNNVNAGAAGFTADLYNMVAAGQRVSIVADKGREEKGYQLSAMLIHKDSSIKSIQDLKGKKIGLTTLGSSNHYMTGRLLEKYGMTLKDVELVPLNTTRNQMEALKGKNVDAVILNSNNITNTIKDGYGKILVNIADEMPYQSVGTFISPKFSENKDEVVRFLRAYIKGARYYYDAVLTQKDGKLVKGQNYDEVVKIAAKYTEQPEEVIKESMPFVDPNGKMLVDDIKTQIDWYTKEKLMSKPLDIKELVNTSFLEEAIKTLK